ncbi:hypothetical protein D8O01_19730, partial [Acinetobacter baumannii]
GGLDEHVGIGGIVQVGEDLRQRAAHQRALALIAVDDLLVVVLRLALAHRQSHWVTPLEAGGLDEHVGIGGIVQVGEDLRQRAAHQRALALIA